MDHIETNICRVSELFYNLHFLVAPAEKMQNLLLCGLLCFCSQDNPPFVFLNLKENFSYCVCLKGLHWVNQTYLDLKCILYVNIIDKRHLYPIQYLNVK